MFLVHVLALICLRFINAIATNQQNGQKRKVKIEGGFAEKLE